MKSTTDSSGGTRRTRYGLPIQEEGVALTTNSNNTSKALAKTGTSKWQPSKWTSSAKPTTPKYSPVSDEITPYGAKKFRTPYRKDQFTGRAGSKLEAVILDIDGTLQGWGQGGDKDVMKWVKKHYDAGHALIVITARDQNMFDTSFNWLMRHLPFPFDMLICRQEDDPRYASEFKREKTLWLSEQYDIVGAADDNEFVNKMWKQWAIDHFEDPADFDLLECDSYKSYSGWRADLPTHGTGYYDSLYGPPAKPYSSYGTGTKPYASTGRTGETWVPGEYKGGKYVAGHWSKVAPKDEVKAEGKHRPAGVSKWDKNDESPTPGHPIDLSNDPRWQHYFAMRNKAGGYTGIDTTEVVGEVVSGAEIDEIIAEIEADRNGYSLRRKDLEAIVAYENPRYSETDIEFMPDDELLEESGLGEGGPISDERWLAAGESEPLFDRFQLDANGIVPEADRKDMIVARLEMEGELYAEDLDLTREEIEDMDWSELKRRLVAVRASFDTAPLDVAEVLAETEMEAQEI
jgi:hypothetical protein